MKIVHSIAGAVSLALAAASPARGQQLGITYDCDTAADHFSELVLPAPAAPFVVTGRVRLMAIAKIEKFAPLTRIAVTEAPAGPGGPGASWAGFKLSALPAKSLGLQKKTDKPVVQILSWDEGTGNQEKKGDPVGLLDYPDSVAFALSYDGSSVALKVGDREQRLPLSVKDPVVRLICSTGEFLYTELKIERAG